LKIAARLGSPGGERGRGVDESGMPSRLAELWVCPTGFRYYQKPAMADESHKGVLNSLDSGRGIDTINSRRTNNMGR
jgi:hypothetical protein